jgi:hypothetical protein
VLTRPGRYKPVADNLQVKEVVVGEVSAAGAMYSASIPKKPNASAAIVSRC